MFSVKNARIRPYWDWLSFPTCNPIPNTFTLGEEGKGKGSLSLCVCTSVISACSFSNSNLPNVAGSEQKAELCGTNTAGQPRCHVPAACEVPEAQATHTGALSCSEIRTEPPTAMNITGMMRVVLFPDGDTSQNSVLHPCPGGKIHLHCFSDRVPLQQI